MVVTVATDEGDVQGPIHENGCHVPGWAAIGAVRLMTGRRPICRDGAGIVVAARAEPVNDASATCGRLRSLLSAAALRSAPGELEVVSGHEMPRTRGMFLSLMGAAMLTANLLNAGHPLALYKIPIAAGVLAMIWSAAVASGLVIWLLRSVVAGPDVCIHRRLFRTHKFPVSRSALLVLVTDWEPIRACVGICAGRHSVQFVARGSGLLHLLATWCAADPPSSDDLDVPAAAPSDPHPPQPQ